MVAESAFRFSSNEDYLFVNWIEYFSNVKSINEQVEEIRKAVSKKLTLRNNGRFAELNVGKIKDRIRGSRIKHIPEDEDPSHSGIYIHDENREATLELVHMIVPDKDVFEAT